MSRSQEGSVFNAMFIERIIDPDLTDPLTEEGVSEAETAGPWSLRQRPDKRWEVAAEAGGPAAVVPSYETALLIAAALPALGRQFFRTANDESPGGLGMALLDARDETIGQFRCVHEETFTAYLNVLEYLRRSPLDLARLMYAAKGPALERAGAILWVWELAGR
jgi:hypothetical protein